MDAFFLKKKKPLASTKSPSHANISVNLMYLCVMCIGLAFDSDEGKILLNAFSILTRVPASVYSKTPELF